MPFTNISGQLTTGFTNTHTDFVCRDTTFLRNTIDINYGKRLFHKAYNLLQTFSTISDAEVRNNQNHAETSDFIILTYTLHIIVLLYLVANRLHITSVNIGADRLLATTC